MKPISFQGKFKKRFVGIFVGLKIGGRKNQWKEFKSKNINIEELVQEVIAWISEYQELEKETFFKWQSLQLYNVCDLYDVIYVHTLLYDIHSKSMYNS